MPTRTSTGRSRRASTRRRSRASASASFRQRFVGITGEREVADAMDRVIKELQAGRRDGGRRGDSRLRREVSRPRAAARRARCKAGWTAYLSRGAKPGEKVLTIEELIASGKMAPGGTAPAGGRAGAGADRRGARRRDEALLSRGAKRSAQLFVDLMDREQLDAMLYPANQARPHTHEGGLRALRQRAGHVRRERGHRPSAGDGAGRLHGRPISGRESRSSAGCGTTGTARDRLRLRAGDESPPAADDGEVAALGAWGCSVTRAFSGVKPGA